MHENRVECNRCNQLQPLSEFYQRVGKSYRRKECRSCKIAQPYGLTKNDTDQILKNQQYKCAICEEALKADTSTVIDHCHSAKRVRGILCKKCNTMLGMARDNTYILENGINYLKSNLSIPIPEKKRINKIREEEVQRIKKLASKGLSGAEIARTIGRSSSVVNKIIRTTRV